MVDLGRQLKFLFDFGVVLFISLTTVYRKNRLFFSASGAVDVSSYRSPLESFINNTVDSVMSRSLFERVRKCTGYITRLITCEVRQQSRSHHR